MNGPPPELLPSLPRDEHGPLFRAPWEAQSFAMAVALCERGYVTWPEWAALLGDEIARAEATGNPDTGEQYYRYWQAALERVVALKGLADGDALARTRAAWERAAARTPHGAPIVLAAEDVATIRACS